MQHEPDFYEQLLENLSDGVYFCNTERKISYWNRGAEAITGFSREEVVGSHVNLRKEGGPLSETIKTGESQERLVYLRHKEGHRLPVLVRTMPVRDENGVVIGAVEVFSRQSFGNDMVKRIQKLEKEALVDPLTRMVNRRHLEASLQTRIEELNRYGWQFGLMFIDIDHFKRVNDDHGHETGDKLLRLVALTLSNSVRPFDLVGRWGGEEFLAIVVNVNMEQLTHIASRARSLVAQSSLIVDDRPLGVTISIGATLAQRGDTVDSLVQRADELMYESKARGRNRITTEIPKAHG